MAIEHPEYIATELFTPNAVSGEPFSLYALIGRPDIRRSERVQAALDHLREIRELHFDDGELAHDMEANYFPVHPTEARMYKNASEIGRTFIARSYLLNTILQALKEDRTLEDIHSMPEEHITPMVLFALAIQDGLNVALRDMQDRAEYLHELYDKFAA